MGVLAIFMLGFLFGVYTTLTLITAIGQRAINKRKKELEKSTPKMESVSSRMKRVKDITSEQMDIQGATSGPQKNAMHGKYKNGLVSRLKELEEQKNEILKSIVIDGFDPEISVMDTDGTVATIKLSEFLAQNGITIPPKGSQPPPQKPTSRFTVHKGGKDDGGTTH